MTNFQKKLYIFVQYRTTLTFQGSYLYPICDLDILILFLLSFILLLVFRFNSNYKSKKYCTVLIELDLLVFAGKLYLTTVQFPNTQHICANIFDFICGSGILAHFPLQPKFSLWSCCHLFLQYAYKYRDQLVSTAAELSTRLREISKISEKAPTSAFSLLKELHYPQA